MAVTSKPHHRPLAYDSDGRLIEVDGYARSRNRGLGKRGAPAARVVDGMDLRLAISELTGAHAMLGEDAATLDHAEGRAHYAAIVGKVVLAIKLCASVTRRRAKLRRASKSTRSAAR